MSDDKTVSSAPVNVAPSVPRPSRILTRDFDAAQFRFNEWSAVLSENQTIEDALDPTFWADVVDKVMGHDKSKPRGLMDIIKVRKPDTMQYVELMITGIGKGFIRVVKSEREFKAAEGPAISQDSPLSPRWNVGRRSYDVIRKADGAVMHSGFQTKGAANEWIADHIQKMAA